MCYYSLNSFYTHTQIYAEYLCNAFYKQVDRFNKTNFLFQVKIKIKKKPTNYAENIIFNLNIIYKDGKKFFAKNKSTYVKKFQLLKEAKQNNRLQDLNFLRVSKASMR